MLGVGQNEGEEPTPTFRTPWPFVWSARRLPHWRWPFPPQWVPERRGAGGGGGRWVVGGILGLSRGKGRVRGRGKSIAGICEVRDRGDAGGEEASWERSAGPGRCVGHIGCILPGRCLVRILCVSTSTQVRLALRSHPAQEDAAPPGCPPPTLSHTHGQSASWSSTDTSVPDRPARFPTLTPSPYTPDRPAP